MLSLLLTEVILSFFKVKNYCERQVWLLRPSRRAELPKEGVYWYRKMVSKKDLHHYKHWCEKRHIQNSSNEVPKPVPLFHRTLPVALLLCCHMTLTFGFSCQMSLSK